MILLMETNECRHGKAGIPFCAECLGAAKPRKVIWGKQDAGKLRWSLMPWKALQEVLKVLELGASKYEPHSWKEIPEGVERYTEAAQRHLAAHLMGETADEESGLSPLVHAAASLLFVIELCIEAERVRNVLMDAVVRDVARRIREAD